MPPSLRNIYKEIEEDLGIKNGTNGDLSDWAKQGVLLINSSLTVEQGIPGSHLNFGWEEFTDHIIKSFNKKKDIVFMLWGKFAANKKKSLLTRKETLFLEASHPSPLSCYKGFLAVNTLVNAILLKSSGRKEINWEII